LHPLHGSLRCRLNKSIAHLPDPDIKSIREKNLRCGLHRWVDRNAQIKRDVMVCLDCRVALCVECYYTFHTEQGVDNLRDYVQIKIQEGKDTSLKSSNVLSTTNLKLILV